MAAEAAARPAPGDPHGLAPRRAALALLAAVLDDGRSLDAAKADPALVALAPAERARAGDLAAATLRWLRPIDALLARLMRQPVAASAAVARDALRLAAAEVGALGALAHAAVDAAVRLCKADRRAALAAPAELAAPEAAVASLPDWLVKRLRKGWGGAGLASLAVALTQDAALDLTPRDPAEAAAWADALGAVVTPGGGLRLARRGWLTTLPGYAEGAWWAQDAAAAMPARLFGELRGRRALDLCAAPGGKTLQLAAAGAAVTALDIAEPRQARLRENLARTSLTAEIVTADALDWRPDQLFDAVLLDAPCTATGTIRRHPDLIHLRRDGDVAAMVDLQDRLLDAAWAMVAPGGRLVFCTCSLLPEEGEARARAFRARWSDALPIPVTAAEVGDAALVGQGGWLRARPDLWPERGGMDGFFAARFDRPA